jgi:pimeloyl-ACP methyl ester carboxylesterase
MSVMMSPPRALRALVGRYDRAAFEPNDGRARLSTLEAGVGPPVLAIHALGGTKGSFLLTVATLAGRFRVVAVDLPGFGDSDKPIGASYDAPFSPT